MKLATWNVMLPVSSPRREAIRAHTDLVHADVWVLTEVHDGLSLGLRHVHSSAPGRDGTHHGPEHRWVTIASNHELVAIATSDDKRTAAARVIPALSVPFLVYGTVLPWLGSTWREHASAGGIAFREAVALQREDWLALREMYPDDELFVMGDLNQDLVVPHYYGSRANREVLEGALADAGLVPLTAGANDPIRRDSAPCACIDHICALRDSAWTFVRSERWPDTPVPDRRLTDHFGVAVTLARNRGE